MLHLQFDFMLRCNNRIIIPTAIARRDSVMSASAGQGATADRAALLANLPDIDVLAPMLACAEPSLDVAHGEINVQKINV